MSVSQCMKGIFSGCLLKKKNKIKNDSSYRWTFPNLQLILWVGELNGENKDGTFIKKKKILMIKFKMHSKMKWGTQTTNDVALH